MQNETEINQNRKTKKLTNKQILLIILMGILGVVLLVFAILGIVLGSMRLATPDEFMIENENYFDYQLNYECSGYASAYVLRSLGEDVTGLELYEEFTNKNEDGTLPPIYLQKNLKRMGYNCSFKTAGINVLKYDISRGTPVVALIRVKTNSKYLHYVTIVGYDKENFYVADSLYSTEIQENEHYNRVIKIEDFKKLWKCYPESMNNVYLIINLK